jgi:NAD(P)-dependent dehydrogenase (short-subunit alcohol dehydrogenase family)
MADAAGLRSDVAAARVAMPERAARTVLITGAARRIGRALALDFAARGWRVGVHCLSGRREAGDLVREIAAGGGEAAVLAADLTVASDIERLVGDCVAALGHPSCLVNNAATFAYDELATLESDRWDRQLAVNLKAPVFLAKAFAAQLPAGTPGNIVNLIDQRVWRPTPKFLSYAASKAGLWAATRMLAQALAPAVRVNAVGPGPCLKSAHQTEAEFAAQCAATILRRGTTTDEIAAAVRFILDAPAMTGQMIALDGGQHLAWETADAGASDG